MYLMHHLRIGFVESEDCGNKGIINFVTLGALRRKKGVHMGIPFIM
jgi:hypothetical protein